MPESIDILDRLIRFNTVSRTPNRDLIDYVRDLLLDAGIESTIVPGDNGANANLYATVGPTVDGGIMLSGHTDVVPTEGQAWTVDPFRMMDKDGRLYGRGTADMKGFVACAIRAMIAAKGRHLSTPLHLALSYDEEIGCVGVRRMIDMLAAAPTRPGFCIVGEPTELAIATGHKGKVAARAISTGREVHSALAPQGVNAIHPAAEFIQTLTTIQADLAENGAKDGDYDVAYSTVHAGVIRGGTALNIVPNECTVDFEIRHLRADDPSHLMARITDAAMAISGKYPDGCGIRIEEVNRYPGLDTPPDAEIVQFMKSLTGANSTTKVAFGTEAGLFDAVLGVPAIVCGPGSMAQGHKPDEFISRAQMDKCDRMLDALLDRISV